MKKQVKRAIVAGIAVFVIAGSTIAYANGYRITDRLSVGKVGTLAMTIPMANTSVFIDDALQYSTTKNFESIALKLSPSTHTVIVSNKTYFPWTKDVSIKSSRTSMTVPLFIAQNPSGMIITQNDPEYISIRENIANTALPTKDKPLVSKDGTTKIWIEDNAIMAQTVTDTHIVIQPDTIVKNIAFYKGRSDAVVFSTSNAVNVIDIDTEGTQNFMPIYKGTDPSFIAASTSPDFLYIQDGETLMQVNI